MRSSTAAIAAALTTITPAAAFAATQDSNTEVPIAPSSGHRAAAGESMQRAGARIERRRQLRDKARARAAARRRARSQATAGTATATTSASSGGGYAGGQLAAIRACESGGNYATDTGNGFYGAYQFTLSTWQSVGGTGNPAQASPAEQDARAAALLARSGSSPWPVCGG